jgi:hypothetical protein
VERPALVNIAYESFARVVLVPSFSPDGRNVIFQLPRSKSETTKCERRHRAMNGPCGVSTLRSAIDKLNMPAAKAASS